jgi:hypothetical protein
MAKTICIMLTSYEAPLNAATAAFRFGALSAEMGNRTVMYLSGMWPMNIIVKGKLESAAREFQRYTGQSPQYELLAYYQRFVAAGGIVWVSLEEAGDLRQQNLMDGVNFIDERALLGLLIEETVVVQY